MPNLSLPEDLSSGSTGHIAQHEAIHTELNRMTRDTGWRDASGALVNGWAGSAQIRRVDDTVRFLVSSLNGAAATDPRFIAFGSAAPAISINFLPLSSNFVLPRHTGEAFDFSFWTSGGSGIRCTMHSGTVMFGQAYFVWPTDRAWPGFLPPAV
ncbi:hypothetical protein [Microbacterium rhizophilus]|uniref:hypothetical protein n=1 Tax=Microbacterium rhizophilus TaxID=3138934 RepID=UPI0031EFA1C1